MEMEDKNDPKSNKIESNAFAYQEKNDQDNNSTLISSK